MLATPKIDIQFTPSSFKRTSVHIELKRTHIYHIIGLRIIQQAESSHNLQQLVTLTSKSLTKRTIS